MLFLSLPRLPRSSPRPPSSTTTTNSAADDCRPRRRRRRPTYWSTSSSPFAIRFTHSYVSDGIETHLRSLYMLLPRFTLSMRSHCSPDPLMRRSKFITKTVVWVIATSFKFRYRLAYSGPPASSPSPSSMAAPSTSSAPSPSFKRTLAHFKRTLAHFFKRAFVLAFEFAFTLKLILVLKLILAFLKLILAFLKLILALKRTTPTR
ncbi:hypothetical protein EV121DRAFT_297648 [Schizophyllum commune]